MPNFFVNSVPLIFRTERSICQLISFYVLCAVWRCDYSSARTFRRWTLTVSEMVLLRPRIELLAQAPQSAGYHGKCLRESGQCCSKVNTHWLCSLGALHTMHISLLNPRHDHLVTAHLARVHAMGRRSQVLDVGTVSKRGRVVSTSHDPSLQRLSLR